MGRSGGVVSERNGTGEQRVVQALLPEVDARVLALAQALMAVSAPAVSEQDGTGQDQAPGLQAGAASEPPCAPGGADQHDPARLLLTVEQLAELWFGEVGEGGSSSKNCQKIRRLISAESLPARRIGKRWYVNRATAQAWAAGADPASVMAHPDSRRSA